MIALSLLAHQGGWDEILLVAAPMVFVVWLLWVAKKRMSRATPPSGEGAAGAQPLPGPGDRADHTD